MTRSKHVLRAKESDCVSFQLAAAFPQRNIHSVAPSLVTPAWRSKHPAPPDSRRCVPSSEQTARGHSREFQSVFDQTSKRARCLV